MSNLRVGDKVIWRGGWGKDEPKEAIIREIVICKPGLKYGRNVSEIEWDVIDGRNIIVDLTNGSWAYGNQLTEIEKKE